MHLSSRLLAPLSALLLPASVVVASCGHGLPFVQSFEPRGIVSLPSFGYDVLRGPLNWHHLDPSYFLCKNGTQSPILLSTTDGPPLAGAESVILSIPPVHNVLFENLATTVEVVLDGILFAANSTWKLAQFHFHTPAEHRVDLGHADAEMHFVFAASDGSARAAVLALFVEASAHHTTPVLETVFSHLGEIEVPGTTTEIATLDFSELQEKVNEMRFFQYVGSLTAPPCTEGVVWSIGTTPIPLHVDTYARLKNVTKTNSRYAQNSLGQQNILEIACKNDG